MIQIFRQSGCRCAAPVKAAHFFPVELDRVRDAFLARSISSETDTRFRYPGGIRRGIRGRFLSRCTSFRSYFSFVLSFDSLEVEVETNESSFAVAGLIPSSFASAVKADL